MGLAESRRGPFHYLLLFTFYFVSSRHSQLSCISSSLPPQPQPVLPLLQLLHPLQEAPFAVPQLLPAEQPMHFTPLFFAFTIYATAPPRIAASTKINITFSMNRSFPCPVSSPSQAPCYISYHKFPCSLRTLLCSFFLCQVSIGLSNHRYQNHYKCRNRNHSRYKALAEASRSE